MGRASDLRSTGRGFISYSGQKLRNYLGQVVHTYVPLSPSSITWYRPKGSDALQLAESNGSLPLGGLPVHRDQLWAQRLVTSMGMVGV